MTEKPTNDATPREVFDYLRKGPGQAWPEGTLDALTADQCVAALRFADEVLRQESEELAETVATLKRLRGKLEQSRHDRRCMAGAVILKLGLDEWTAFRSMAWDDTPEARAQEAVRAIALGEQAIGQAGDM